VDEHLQPRIGDRERDEAVRLLQEHLAAGRLDQSEFSERMSAALAARTQADLEPLFVDLPGAKPWGTELVPTTTITPSQRQRWRRWAAVANGVAWPAVMIYLFATGNWQHWWLILVAMFLVPAVVGQFGEDDKREDAVAPRPASPSQSAPEAIEPPKGAGPVTFENPSYRDEKLKNPDDLR